MHPSIIASAIAARAYGYIGVADTILADGLAPTQIVRLFSLSASPAGRVCAIVLLAGSTARYNSSCRQGFDGSVERDLAINALGGQTGFVAANREAVKLVQFHWDEIGASLTTSL
jgi:hypothetical protein